MPNALQQAGTPINRILPAVNRKWLFGFVILLSAGLLFQVQFITAKYILPWFGGTPGVWTTCLLFFQLLLLFGYAYAHAVANRLTPRRQSHLHIALLTLAVVILTALAFYWRAPILPGPAWKPQGAGGEVPHILTLLFVSVGIPFFLLSTTGPLLQYWFGGLYPNSSPYPLYALSNFGSLAGLLSYPFLVEPLLRMPVQAWLWSSCFLAFAITCSICARMFATSGIEKTRSAEAATDESPPDLRTRAQWVLLAMLPSVLLLSTTNIICQEVAVIALLWALPLSIYLISFVLCFARGQFYVPGAAHVGFGISAYLLAVWVVSRQMVAYRQIAILVFVFFVCCMFCHGELYRRRPGSAHLTTFYLCISLGGALGGVFVSLIAPHVFPGFWEFWLAIFACLALMLVFVFRDPGSWLRRTSIWIPVALALFALTLALRMRSGIFEPWHYLLFVPALLTVACGIRKIRSGNRVTTSPSPIALRLTRVALVGCAAGLVTICVTSVAAGYRARVWSGRNFYGVLAINHYQDVDPQERGYTLVHGRTLHGFQLESPGSERVPTSYYSRDSGVGLTFENHYRMVSQQDLNVGVIGLGIGTVAAYGRAGDHFRFYEINDRVIRIARGKYGHFSYLSSCPAAVTVVPGDARISLERELQAGQKQDFDILVVDAFSSDAIPVHLLTAEAMQLYLQHLRDEHSVVAFHISNKSLDLVPVVTRLAEYFGLVTERVVSTGNSPVLSNSEWMLVSRDADFFKRPELRAAVRIIPPRRVRLWTDDYSNLAQIWRY